MEEFMIREEAPRPQHQHRGACPTARDLARQRSEIISVRATAARAESTPRSGFEASGEIADFRIQQAKLSAPSGEERKAPGYMDSLIRSARSMISPQYAKTQQEADLQRAKEDLSLRVEAERAKQKSMVQELHLTQRLLSDATTKYYAIKDSIDKGRKGDFMLQYEAQSAWSEANAFFMKQRVIESKLKTATEFLNGLSAMLNNITMEQLQAQTAESVKQSVQIMDRVKRSSGGQKQQFHSQMEKMGDRMREAAYETQETSTMMASLGAGVDFQDDDFSDFMRQMEKQR